MADINYIITITIPADPGMSWEQLENDVIDPILAAYPNAVATESYSMDGGDDMLWGTYQKGDK